MLLMDAQVRLHNTSEGKNARQLMHYLKGSDEGTNLSPYHLVHPWPGPAHSQHLL